MLVVETIARIRRWALHHRSDKALDDLAQVYNPYIQGWTNYFRHFYEAPHLNLSSRPDLRSRAANWVSRLLVV